MKISIAIVAVLSAVMAMAGPSYAGEMSKTMASQSSNAATPAVPGKDGTPATPAVPGNPLARAAIANGKLMREDRGVSGEYTDADSGVVTRPQIERPQIEQPQIEQPQITRPDIERPSVP